MTKVALYARYSSENQRDASIEDQLRLCRLHAERQGWTVVDSYSDRAISGASLLRPAIQELIADAMRGRFQIVLSEAMDRLSRDQEDIAGLFKRMAFAGVKIVTLSEGEVTSLHVGLKGTMNAIFLKDLADKVRRGLRGRVALGKAGGGNSYGYDVVKQFASDGEPVRGDRKINEAEASIVRRIYGDYSAGKSPKKIAFELNAEGVPGPAGREWGFSTILGSSKRGNGILNNELYIGRIVWNRQRFIKDPDTGKRVSRLNPRDEWVVQEVPELRIVDQDLWNKVKARQQTTNKDQSATDGFAFRERRRVKYLFSGLTRCACCGGGYTMISKDLLGCATARNKGTCTNRLNIRRDQLEPRILNALQHRLMNPTLFKDFCEEFTREMNRLRMEGRATLDAARLELKRIDREMEKLVQALLDETLPAAVIKERSSKLEARKTDLEQVLTDAEEPPPLLHPSMAEIYRSRLTGLHEALSREETRTEAAEIIRSLVDEIVLTPEDGELKIDLRGDLAGILAIATNGKRPIPAGNGLSEKLASKTQVQLVAGERNLLKLRSPADLASSQLKLLICAAA